MRRPTLDQLTNLVIIATSLTFLGILAIREAPRRTNAAGASAFAVGKPGPQLSGVSYRDHDQTLVMFLSSSCGYCTASMPFYQTLTAIRKNEQGLRLAVASLDAVDVSRAYLRDHNVDVDSIVTTRTPVATPTLLLVDQSGTVRNVWTGKQDPDGERKVIDTITGALAQLRENGHHG